MCFPGLETMFPPAGRLGVAWFWLRYWFWFALFQPLAWLRQVGVLLDRTYVAFTTRGRLVELLDGALGLRYLSYTRSLITDILFGERFVVIRYDGALFDPGPAHAQSEVEEFALALPAGGVSAVICTHLHEEHIGNASFLGQLLSVPVYGTEETLAEIRRPSQLPWYRKLFLGAPEGAADGAELRQVAAAIAAGAAELRVLESPGHCAGHVSFYDPARRLLLAGDSFMGEFFTAPNGDVNADDWIGTLQRYAALDIDILVDGHGKVYTLDPDVPALHGVVVHQDPGAMIRTKLAFLCWAREVVREGERRGLDYRLIETCLFRWDQHWVWTNWCTDQSFRFLSGGEFSRTQFLRSLAADPAKVPDRHRWLVLAKTWLYRTLGRSHERAFQNP